MFSFEVKPAISVGTLFESFRRIYLEDEEEKSPLPQYVVLRVDKKARIHYFQVPFDRSGIDNITGSLISRLSNLINYFRFEVIDDINFHRGGSINYPLASVS